METVISLDKIVKNYYIGSITVEALRSVDIDIKKNEYVAIMGPSGSGKSTLMNLVGALDTPTSGEYILSGTDVSKMDDNMLAEIRNQEIGFIFQTFNLLPRYTALENVMLPLIYAGVSKSERAKQAKHTLEEVGLGDRMDHKPTELSGGQMQRVAVARALAMNPDVILADEPTGNLDTSSGGDIMGLFEELWGQGRTVIVITHDKALARRTSRIIEIRDGLVTSEEKNPESNR